MPVQIVTWACQWCGDTFHSEEKCRAHEKYCGYNPEVKPIIYAGRRDPNLKVRFLSG